MDIGVNCTSVSWSSGCKGPEARASQMCLMNRKEVSGMGENEYGEKQQEVNWRGGGQYLDGSYRPLQRLWSLQWWKTLESLE